ncbi:symmetrical bis(5'-nucleosyl)-tetraphosphatase [Simiduia aestuariiviva]|uniref:Bis(5'-nucleosyl)-tetraphosphatase, symmetrical n=1 Tax=Simiduia aestuariiviva TaxID=1510459 RepID=A0A839UGV1_9GAMM|nr:symmetrical bis(5'-nucleosyl)-tetraphosphatase [Simiduia aestuariiviva]MBB3167274.1 bis(5'-nucleosyl)-tetraphosphatase (symmetrical) [Simiduia aestuariiviva]
MATYAVGDIQGCYDPLQRLLKDVSFDPARDRLWVAGDLINRGPQSLEVLRYLRGLGDALVVVLGNHDLHFLAVAEGVRKPSKSDTLEAVLAAPDLPDIVQWLRRQPLLHCDKVLGYALVHAGIPPQWSLKKALKRAAEVEQVLQSGDYRRFLKAMYGNEPAGWRKGLRGMKRLRVITNYLTRMRFCDPAGQLDLTNKSAPHAVNLGYAPWFALENRKTRGERIIFGHWAALEGQVSEADVFALDTGCVWGGCLTLMRLEDQARFQVQCKG